MRDVQLVSSEWNHTFRIDTSDGAAYALRIYRPTRRTDDEIETEVAWLMSLADAGLRIPRPIRASDGSAFVRVEDSDSPEPWRAAVFTWIPGERLGDDPARSAVVDFGEAIARLHEHGRQFEATRGLRRWDSPFPHGERSLFDRAHADVVDDASSVVFERAADAVRRAIERLWSEEPPRIVHGDLHQENVFVHDGEVAFVDFDDCMLAWPVQDLGVTMWEVGEDEASWPYREALRTGYEQMAPWPERHIGDIDTFAANRGLLKADDIVGARKSRDDREVRDAVRRHARAISWFLERTSQ
ncbi:MAG TPA: phosphotransferase [Actinomycetota bacterium]|nr:phosphotransferase [Actinomycetota bacterium]